MELKILQIVGYQNSGKTTLATKIIHHLSKTGLRVGTIKHHGHSTSIAPGDEGKDTEKHRSAGAISTCIESNEDINIILKNNENWSLPQLINFYKMLPLDFILVEGYKKENYPKIVLLRSQKDNVLLNELDNILCVIHQNDKEDDPLPFPSFQMKDEVTYLNWIINWIKGAKL